jgi:threonylcarbamoyladenosine tRNA methylthiotransferase MtaB
MKVAFQTLGCKVNLYETEAVWSMLKDMGYERVEFNEYSDVYILNTCTVTNKGDSKSRKFIRQAVKKNPDAVVAVMGCYAQISPEEVLEIEGVDVVVGTQNRLELPQLIEKYRLERKLISKVSDIMKTSSYESLNLDSFTENTRAFLKIQDGCNNFCSYCIIPFARGPVRSRAKDEVIAEANRLVKNGYKEIVLTGIHTGGYGLDLEDYDFCDLLKDLERVEGLKRLRISSIEINELTDDVIDVLASSDVIVNHLHIPIQAGCDETLKRMNRKYDTIFFKERINYIRDRIKDVSITGDIIVGFPQETDEEFSKTVSFVKEINFMDLHVFPYSVRSGTKAAVMPGQISPQIKSERVKVLSEIAQLSKNKFIVQRVGQEYVVLTEMNHNQTTTGHTTNFIHVKIDEVIESNQLVKVKITGCDKKHAKAIVLT